MRVCTFDTESDGFVADATRIWCASAQIHSEDFISSWIFDCQDDLEAFINFLESCDVIIGHNLINHDLPLLKKLWNWEPQPRIKIIDTLLMSRLQKPDRRIPPHCPDKRCGPHSVKAWGYRVGIQKVDHDEWDRYSPEMLTRCEEDVRIQVEIYKELAKEGEGKGWGPAHRLNHQLFPWLRRQEEAGFKVDKEYMDDCIRRLSSWINRIDRAISPHLPIIVEIEEGKIEGEYGYVKKPFKKDGTYSAVTERFVCRYADNPDTGYCVRSVDVGGPFSRVKFRYTDLESNMEVKDFLLKSGWVPDQWNVNNDGDRTSPKMTKDDPFVGISGGLGKLVVKRVQCKQRKGVIEGWIEQSRDDGRLSAQVAGLAVTGRARHRVVVNVPGSSAFFGKQMRQMFVSEPGKVLVGIDSVGNQIRQLAARMGDDDFTNVVLDPEIDIHQYNADRAGIAVRHHAKTFYYALIFGAQDLKISRTLKISLEEARQLRKDFLDGMPYLNPLLKKLKAEWEKNGGWIKGLDGRPLAVPRAHQLLVYLLQSDEAIQMSHAYVNFHKKLFEKYKYGEDWKTVLFMHDEIQVECIPKIANDVGKIGCWSITEAGKQLNILIPHMGKYKIGETWYETH